MTQISDPRPPEGPWNGVIPEGLEEECKLLGEMAVAYHEWCDCQIYNDEELDERKWGQYLVLKFRVLKIMDDMRSRGVEVK